VQEIQSLEVRSQTQNQDKSHFFHFMAHFQGKEKTFLPGLLQEMKLGSIILNQGQKYYAQNGTTSISPEEKFQKVSISMQPCSLSCGTVKE
jgi:hypothetical protein